MLWYLGIKTFQNAKFLCHEQEKYMYLLMDSTRRFCPASVLYMDMFEEDLMSLHILLLLNDTKKKYLHFKSVFL